MPRQGIQPAMAALLVALLAACGGGGGDAPPALVAPPAVAGALNDDTAYSSAGGASLATSTERAALTSHTLALGATHVAYRAQAGHLDARDPLSGATKASMFYVAYTVDGATTSQLLL